MSTSRRVSGRRVPRAGRGVAVAAAAVLLATGCQVASGPVPVAVGDPGVVDVRLSVDGTRALRSISPLVYGSNSSRGLASNRQTLLRLGGNRWTAYNWENNASNAGSDWCFQNDGFLSSSNVPGAAVTPTVTSATAAGAAALVTVPIVDHVAADKNGGCDVRNSGPNYLQTRFRQNRPRKGAALSPSPDTSDGYVNQDEFVAWLSSTQPGARVLYSLDNEPDLWSSTHAEVHPDAVTYAELAQRNIDYAAAIKSVAPAAEVTGPVNYGFYGIERLQGAPDNGGRDFMSWYLDQLRADEVARGSRVIDDVDVHWYPEATGGGVRITGPDTSAAVVAARVQAPRSLWDPSYVETSWITDPAGYNYGPINLLGKLRDRIAAHYPGTGIAVTEWNYGGGDHISGAVAAADVLGIFGRDGVRAACLWELNGNESYTYAAFRAYRNYDGAGGSFGDVALPATTSDVATATVYASQTTGATARTVVVAINKATTARVAGITVGGYRAVTAGDVYTITAGGGANVIPAGSISAVASNAFRYTMPAMSVSVLVF